MVAHLLLQLARAPLRVEQLLPCLLQRPVRLLPHLPHLHIGESRAPAEGQPGTYRRLACAGTSTWATHAAAHLGGAVRLRGLQSAGGCRLSLVGFVPAALQLLRQGRRLRSQPLRLLLCATVCLIAVPPSEESNDRVFTQSKPHLSGLLGTGTCRRCMPGPAESVCAAESRRSRELPAGARLAPLPSWLLRLLAA